MLRGNEQMRLSLSPYRGIYDLVVPKDHLLRKIKGNIDFSFVNPMLKKQYCEKFGRPAKEPEMMFKLMFLKKLYDLSDERLISQAQTDMACKYFLDLDPEDEMIAPSLMTKFRKTRISEDILEEMLKETIRQACDKGIIKSNTIIVDSTHTIANVRIKTATQVLRDLSKQLRKEIYINMYDISAKLPEKPSLESGLEDEIAYTRQLLENTKEEIETCGIQKLKELYERIRELLDSDRIREIRSKDDEDARIGHKASTKRFFGYKNHIAITEERIITGIEVTGGNADDGKQLQALVKKSQSNGICVKEVIGDTAFSSVKNIDFCKENDISLIALSNPRVSNLAEPKKDGFDYNKDAKTMQCPAGELAISCRKKPSEIDNAMYYYRFSHRTCNACSLKGNCVAYNKKYTLYHITILNAKNKARIDFEKMEDFQKRLQVRYRIEGKNGELKQSHGLRRADSTGLKAMRLQMFFTAFTANLKRIVKIIEM